MFGGHETGNEIETINGRRWICCKLCDKEKSRMFGGHEIGNEIEIINGRRWLLCRRKNPDEGL